MFVHGVAAAQVRPIETGGGNARLRGTPWVFSAGVALFCLLPHSLWTYLALPSGIAGAVPWREIIVFGIPGFVALALRVRVGASTIRLIGFATCTFLIALFWSASARDLPLIAIALGALPYFATSAMLLFFFSLRVNELESLVNAVAWGLLIGGGGLILDFATGYQISMWIESAGIPRVTQQTSLVPRAMSLFAGPAHAASFLSLSIYTIVVASAFGLVPQASPETRRFRVIAVCVAILGILLTFSRVGFLALGLLAVFWLLTHRSFKALLLALVAGAVLVAAVDRLLDDTGLEMLSSRVLSLAAPEAGGDLDQGRIDKWKTALKDLEGNWLVGSGVGRGNPRNRNHGVDIAHYESFPLWVANESGILGALLMFLPYVLSAIFVLRASVGAIDKALALFIVGVIYLVVFVNPGGANFEIIAISSLIAALFARLPRSSRNSTGFGDSRAGPGHRRIR